MNSPAEPLDLLVVASHPDDAEISVGGKVTGVLELTIPQQACGVVSSKALVRLRNNKLDIAPLALAFDQVNGDLRFDDAALTLKGAKLRWRGQQLKLALGEQTAQTAHFIDSGTTYVDAAQVADYQAAMVAVTDEIMATFKDDFLVCN